MAIDYFWVLTTIAQLKVFKGRVFASFFFFSFFFSFFAPIHSSPTLMPMSLRREVHAHQRNPRGRQFRPTSVKSSDEKSTRKTTQSNAGEDWVPSGLVYSSFHKPISPSSPISLLSHPWQYSLKLEMNGSWELGHTWKRSWISLSSKTRSKKKSETHFPKVSFLKKIFTIFYPVLFEFQFLLMGFFSFVGI